MVLIGDPRDSRFGSPLQLSRVHWVSLHFLTLRAYELHELQESFDRAARVWPMYRKSNIAELLASTMKEPMDAVAEAIKSADPAKFNDTYARLTATCNACHQSTERPLVVIQVPKTSPFPDQDFRPVKP